MNDTQKPTEEEKMTIKAYIWKLVRKWLYAAGIVNAGVIVSVGLFVYRDLPEIARQKAVQVSESEIRLALDEAKKDISDELVRLKRQIKNDGIEINKDMEKLEKEIRDANDSINRVVHETLFKGNEELDKLLLKAGEATSDLKHIQEDFDAIKEDLNALPAEDVKEVKAIVVKLKENPKIKDKILKNLIAQNDKLLNLSKSLKQLEEDIYGLETRINHVDAQIVATNDRFNSYSESKDIALMITDAVKDKATNGAVSEIAVIVSQQHAQIARIDKRLGDYATTTSLRTMINAATEDKVTKNDISDLRRSFGGEVSRIESLLSDSSKDLNAAIEKQEGTIETIDTVLGKTIKHGDPVYFQAHLRYVQLRPDGTLRLSDDNAVHRAGGKMDEIFLIGKPDLKQ